MAQTIDRRTLLRRGAGIALVLAGWELAAKAAAADPRLVALQKVVKGAVLVPPSAAYQQARVLYQQRFDSIYPLGVVQPLSAADVSQIVLWSKKTKVRLAIRSGGHSYAGYSTGTGLVVDLRRLGSVNLDSASGIATIGAGARLIDVEAALAARGRAIPSRLVRDRRDRRARARAAASGFASRKFGTTSDNVPSLGIVTADGQLPASATRSTNADLFWACRGGGGGNFGVVTTSRSGPTRSRTSRLLRRLALGAGGRRDRGLVQAFAPRAPDELFSICSLCGRARPRRASRCFGQYLGAEPRSAALLAPLRSSPALPAHDRLLELPRRAAPLGRLPRQDDRPVPPRRRHPGGHARPRDASSRKSDYVNAPLSAAGAGDDRATGSSSRSRRLRLRLAPARLLRRRDQPRPGRGATAFVHRNALVLGPVPRLLGSGRRPRARARVALAASTPRCGPTSRASPTRTTSTPSSRPGSTPTTASNYPRLAQIKAQVDPGHLFRFAQAIS